MASLRIWLDGADVSVVQLSAFPHPTAAGPKSPISNYSERMTRLTEAVDPLT
ncbi:MAG: hypothetical protein ACJAWY_000880 [Sphingomonas echinoides]|jgi:hypothetical protein